MVNKEDQKNSEEILDRFTDEYDDDDEFFVVGNVYETITDIIYNDLGLDEVDEEDFDTQDDDPGNLSREFFVYAKQNNLIKDDDIILPTGTKIIKIENTGGDLIDNYERFIIKNTNVEVAINSDWSTWRDLVRYIPV